MKARGLSSGLALGYGLLRGRGCHEQPRASQGQAKGKPWPTTVLRGASHKPQRSQAINAPLPGIHWPHPARVDSFQTSQMLRLHEPSANMALHPGSKGSTQPVSIHHRCYAWHLDRQFERSFPLQFILSGYVAQSIDRQHDADICRLQFVAQIAGTRIHHGCREVY